MNIYIYGNHSFKKDINEALERGNIKFKIDSESLIKEIDNLTELKQAIKENPFDIYLIDDDKIIKKNSLNQKIKFFAPKDGIEEEFLLNSGIADLSINSLDEIPKYILRKYEEQKQANEPVKESIFDEPSQTPLELDDELASLLTKEENVPTIKVENTESNYLEEESLDDLFNLVNESISKENSNIDDLFDMADIQNSDSSETSKNEFNDIMNFNDDFGLNNISFDYDDEATANEAEEPEENEIVTEEEDDFFKMISETEPENEDDDNEEIFEDIDFLEEIFTNQEKNKQEKEEKIDEIKTFDESLQRKESMNNDEFFELDSLNEKDLLEALSGNLDAVSTTKKTDLQTTILENNSNSVNITSSSNVDELASLISKLLKNKTLEITIKIKD